MGMHAGYAEACNERDSSKIGSALFSILAYFLREIVCSPVRFARVLSRIVADLPQQISAFQLLRIGALARFVYSNPKFLFKHLPPKYLIRDLPAPTRTACFVHHYQRLSAVLSERLFEQILVEDVALFHLCQDDHRFEICMGRARQVANSRHVDHEGELSLNLLVDGAHVFVLFVHHRPGVGGGIQAAEVLVVTRIQGSLGVFPQISLLSKAMHGIPPEMLLMTALQGVGEAFGIRAMAGVSAERHLCYEEEDDAIFKRSYDELFMKIGAIKNEAGYFEATFPLPEKALSEVKRGQKTRTRTRRAFKLEVVKSAIGCLRGPKPVSADPFDLGLAVEEDSSEAVVELTSN